jgi:CheY-like chemotaxis protein
MEGSPTASESLTVLGNAAICEPFDIIGIAPPIEDMSSIDLAKTIRSSDPLSGVKMFYVAEQNCSDEIDRAMAAGFDATIERPFRKDDLFMTLAGLVGMKTFKQACPVVLIVEDNAVNQKVETFIMRLLGFESLTVSNGKEALEALEQREFVAVLMDLQMPVMDGIEATRIIRQRERKKHIPIIALTANSDWKEDAMNAGCDEFLVKPASKELIKLALGKHLPSIIPGTEYQERKVS